MAKRQDRMIALAAARELLVLMGIQPETVHADEAFRALDELFYSQPQSVAYRWWESADGRQVDLFVGEWEDWREVEMARCPICRGSSELIDGALCSVCSALFEGQGVSNS